MWCGPVPTSGNGSVSSVVMIVFSSLSILVVGVSDWYNIPFMYSVSCSVRVVGVVDVRKLVKRVLCSEPQTPVSASRLETYHYDLLL
jgi:hypothetical protein